MILLPHKPSKCSASPRGASGSKYCLIAITLVFFGLESASFSAQSDTTAKASQLMQTGNFRDAETSWRQLAIKYPRNAQVHANLGVCLAQQEKFQQATVEYRKSLEIEPNQPDVRYNLGLAEFKQGHFSLAIPIFDL